MIIRLFLGNRFQGQPNQPTVSTVGRTVQILFINRFNGFSTLFKALIFKLIMNYCGEFRVRIFIVRVLPCFRG